MQEPLRVFVSYSRRDKEFLKELEIHLAPLRRQKLISVWTDQQIDAGTEWRGAIEEKFEAADLALLLVSPDFIASDFCYEDEMTQALERHVRGTTRVIPILVRPVDLQGTPIARLQALPRDNQPVTTWPNRDEAWLDIVQGIRSAVQAGKPVGARGSMNATGPMSVGAVQRRDEVPIKGDTVGSVIVAGHDQQAAMGRDPAQHSEVTLATGTFVGRAGHFGRGSIHLVRRGNGQVELRFGNDFAVSQCPGPVLYLSSRSSLGAAVDPNADIYLGVLRSYSGAQIYAVLPAGAEVGRPYTWVYDEPFRVEVAMATIGGVLR
jgi:hypothetical protein